MFLSGKAEIAVETRSGFFIVHYKTAENFPRRFLRTLNESVLTIRIAALVLAYKL